MSESTANKEVSSLSEDDKNYRESIRKYYQLEKAHSVYSALAIFFVCVIMGVPIWWKTTSVYRSDLPYTQISQLARQTPRVTVNMEVILLDGRDQIGATQFGELLSKYLSDVQEGSVEIRLKGRMRVASKKEKQVWQKANSIAEFELHSSVRAADSQTSTMYTVWVVPSASQSKELQLPYAGTLGSIYIEEAKDDDTTVRNVKELINSLIDLPWLTKQYQSEISYSSDVKVDMDRMRALKSSASYGIVFTLLVPEPDQVFVEWDVAAAVQDYLSSLQSMTAPYLGLTFKSQVLYYTGISRKPKRQDDGTFYLASSDLPSLINPIEGRLNSFVTTDPILNFVVYIPTKATSPLHILASDGSALPTNAFLSPRWGGFHIYNVPENTTSNMEDPIPMDMRQVMGVFLPQIRALIGIRKLAAHIHTGTVGSKGLADWELHSWLRERTLENIAKTNVALTSLARLVEQVRNMVINDEVGLQVHEATGKLSESMVLLSEGKVEEAFLASQQALLSAEKAFFDHTLLELLYFPEDQKFAIYIPLFLPAGLPILGSLLAAYKFYFKKGGDIFSTPVQKEKETTSEQKPEPEGAASDQHEKSE